MQHRALVVAALFALLPVAHADDIDITRLSGAQDDFRLLSEDLGSALSYKPVAPGEPLGPLGFDIGIEATATDLQNSGVYRRVTDSSESFLIVPKLHAHKGLPWRINIDAAYSTVPGSNIELLGGSIGVALLEGGVTSPALTLRAGLTRLSGVDELDFDTRSVELTISKGFAMLTPYAGIGRVDVDSKPNGAAATALARESFNLNKLYAGLNINLGLVNLAFEADKTGDANSYSAKFGLRF